MPITDIKNYNFQDVVASIKNMLTKSSYDEDVRQLAVEIISHGEDPISAIYDWTKQNCKYVPDPQDAELFISPIRMVKDFNEGKQIAGDCDDHALLNTALLRAVGINAHVAILDTKGNGWDHATAVAYSNKLSREIFVDTTSQFPLGWTEKYVNRYDVGV